MSRFIHHGLFNKILGVTVSVVCAIVTSIFVILFVNREESGYIAVYGRYISFAVVFVVCVLTALNVLFYLMNKEMFYKAGLICLVLLCVSAILLYLINVSGFMDKVDSIEDLREYIASYGGLSTVLFLFVQILQVTIIPIPGVVTIGAGVLLFGPFLGAVYSFIGILVGSIIAFCMGRIFGYKLVKWLVGKDNLDKGLSLVKGKDKIVLSFMFLLPFFPDDLLCFISGLSSMSPKFYLVMIIIARLISTFTTAYSVNGSLVPYNTWWGMLIWAFLIAACLWLVRIVYNKSEKIEKFFKRRKK